MENLMSGPRRARLLIAAALLVAAATADVSAQDVERLRRDAWAEVDARQDRLVQLSQSLWRFAETSLREVRSAEAMIAFLEEEGFTVERGVADMPTAFVATWGTGSPVVGILAEFDALPGLSNVVATHKEPLAPGAPGHGCGHNLFGTASAGAAVAAKAVMETHGISGTVKLFGTPAEETVIGKVYMARDGVFDGLDAALDWHPSDHTGVDFSRTRAMNNFKVEFFGATAHGASDPWNGRSALDAVELMNHAVNMLREHVRPSTRIHYVIEDGGGAPNVVPDYARVWYYVRDLDRDGVESTYQWVLQAAEGAAMATQTTHEVNFITGVHAYLLNRPLSELLDRNLRAVGPPRWTDEEQAFARAIQQATDKPEEGMFEGIEDLPDEEIPAQGGSTDVAEVSRLAPTAKLRVASTPVDAPWHAWPVVATSGMSIGHKAMLTAARVLGAAAVEIMVSPDVVQAARQAFAEKMAGQPYETPLPEGQRPPVPDEIREIAPH